MKAPSSPMVSVIVPTYREAENLPFLIDRLDSVRHQAGFTIELLIMDDDSCDGTEEVIAHRGDPWITLIVRKANRGLSQAVSDGLRLAKGDILVVMDADLSHPPESIPELVAALFRGADFAVGSRYTEGGSTDADWSAFRWLNSRVATLLARPFTNARDPMSGFFALTRETYERGAAALNPIGYKIGLELIVKCRCRKIEEIPIHFSERQFGESKLTIAEQIRYLRHLRLLLVFKYGTWSHLAQFLVVGGLGTIVNLAVLTVLLLGGMRSNIAIAVAIAVSMVFNFALNRRITFSYARHQSAIRHFTGFVTACSMGAVVNYAVAIMILVRFPAVYPQVAALFGIAAGTGINFSINRYVVFKHQGKASD